MPISEMTENVAIHQTLGDAPNVDNALSADQLKAKFDQAAVALKTFINQVLVPAVNGKADGADYQNLEQTLATLAGDALKKTGGTMTGRLRMSGQPITLDPGDGSYVAGSADETLHLGAGGENVLDLLPGLAKFPQGARLTGVSAPQADTDAANKAYVDARLGPQVPAYWLPALNAAAAKVCAQQDEAGADGTSFLLFSDLHVGSNAGHTGALAAWLMDRCQIPYAIFCGDAVRSAVAPTEEDMESDFDQARSILSPIGNRLLSTEGNHDGSWGALGGQSYVFNYTPQQLYSRIYRPKAPDARVFGPGGCCYYLDDPAHKLRYILLNSIYNAYGEDENGAAVNPRQNSYGLGQAQLTWLAETALHFPEEGWAVVLASHVPIGYANQAQFRDLALVRGILTAFAGGGTYFGTCQGTAGGAGYTNLADTSSPDWKAGTRVSSAGAETAAQGVTTTNFIPAAAGQTLHIKGLDLQSAAPNGEFYGRIHLYDAGKNLLAQINPHAKPAQFHTASYDSAVTTYHLFDYDEEGGQYAGGDSAAYIRLTGVPTGEIALALDQNIAESAQGWDYASVSVDYTQAKLAKIVGFFAGHLHRDLIADYDLPFRVVTVTCDADLSYDPNAPPAPRAPPRSTPWTW